MTAAVGDQGIATQSGQIQVEEQEISIADQMDALNQMKEDNKADIKLAAKVEAQRKLAHKADEEAAKKKKIEDAKEAEMEKQVDPELKVALENNQFTEDMLSMLLKQSEKRPSS